jgi:hypothetical protein
VSDEREMYAEITRTWSEPGFEHWQPKFEPRKTGFGRRTQAALGELEPHEERRKVPYAWALSFLCNYQKKLTPKQAEALHLTYVAQVPLRKAASMSRWPCSPRSYRDRLASTQRHVTTVLRAEARADGKRPSEVRRGKNLGR